MNEICNYYIFLELERFELRDADITIKKKKFSLSHCSTIISIVFNFSEIFFGVNKNCNYYKLHVSRSNSLNFISCWQRDRRTNEWSYKCSVFPFEIRNSKNHSNLQTGIFYMRKYLYQVNTYTCTRYFLMS